MIDPDVFNLPLGRAFKPRIREYVREQGGEVIFLRPNSVLGYPNRMLARMGWLNQGHFGDGADMFIVVDSTHYALPQEPACEYAPTDILDGGAMNYWEFPWGRLDNLECEPTRAPIPAWERYAETVEELPSIEAATPIRRPEFLLMLYAGLEYRNHQIEPEEGAETPLTLYIPRAFTFQGRRGGRDLCVTVRTGGDPQVSADLNLLRIDSGEEWCNSGRVAGWCDKFGYSTILSSPGPYTGRPVDPARTHLFQAKHLDHLITKMKESPGEITPECVPTLFTMLGQDPARYQAPGSALPMVVDPLPAYHVRTPVSEGEISYHNTTMNAKHRGPAHFNECQENQQAWERKGQQYLESSSTMEVAMAAWLMVIENEEPKYPTFQEALDASISLGAIVEYRVTGNYVMAELPATRFRQEDDVLYDERVYPPGVYESAPAIVTVDYNAASTQGQVHSYTYVQTKKGNTHSHPHILAGPGYGAPCWGEIGNDATANRSIASVLWASDLPEFYRFMRAYLTLRYERGRYAPLCVHAKYISDLEGNVHDEEEEPNAEAAETETETQETEEDLDS